jgi:cytochrome c-type biogenesis protein
MLLFLISILAGILTVLAPCILPLLPIVIGASDPQIKERKISRRAVVIISSLSVSVIIFTLILKASTLLIDIPQSFWNTFSGTIIILLGLAMLFPKLWSQTPFVNKIKNSSNVVLGKGHQRGGDIGNIIVGLSLGPVFSTCSPTYLFIIATALPASFLIGLTYLLGFTFGMALSLFLIAYLGQSIVNRLMKNDGKSEMIKKVFGILILIVGIAILTGYDKKVETWILDFGYGATINFELDLIDRFEK